MFRLSSMPYAMVNISSADAHKGGAVRTAVLLTGFLCCQHSIAADITWLKTDWPPHQITIGQYLEQGTFDKLQELVVAGLPQLTHQVKVVNLPRLEQAFLQNRQTVCSFGSLFSEKRVTTRWYSKAVAVLPGLAVHFRQNSDLSQHKAIQPDGSIDVLHLVEDKALTGVYQPNRFYPNSVINAAQQSNLVPQEFNSEINAVSLLLSKRVDYVVEYPERMAFYLKDNKKNQKGPQIRSLQVSDASPYVVSYITCNKSPEGQQLIAEINKVLERLWQQSYYKTAMFYWLDESMKFRLDSAYSEVQLQVLNSSALVTQ